jgi:CRP-like cAMP-binding protein
MRAEYFQAANRFLALLPAGELETLLPHIAEVPLANGTALHDGVYFPLGGLISAVVLTAGGHALHTAMIGPEGAAGLGGLRLHPPNVQYLVLASGRAARIPFSFFGSAAMHNGAIREMHLRYCEYLLGEAQQTAACNALHEAHERLCSWLLQADDRLHGEALPFTQELLGEMLGVRRTTVTFISQQLQTRGLIRYRRGSIRILDRAALEKEACECYGHIRSHAQRCFEREPSRP